MNLLLLSLNHILKKSLNQKSTINNHSVRIANSPNTNFF